MPHGSWYAHQLIHNTCVRTCIGWYVRQPMHYICVRIYVRLCQESSCAGPLINIYFVNSVLTPIAITGKIYSTANKTSILQIKNMNTEK